MHLSSRLVRAVPLVAAFAAVPAFAPVPAFAAVAALAAAAAVTPATTSAQQFDTLAFKDLRYRMAGPYRGGRSTAATGFANDPDRWLMGTTGGGVWESDDNGVTWRNISDGYFGGSIGAVTVPDSDPNVIYVGGGSMDIRGNTSAGRGAWKSMDGGRSWTFIGLREAGQIGRIEVHPRDHDLVYAAALGHPFGKNPERGIFRSDDGGSTWEHVLSLNDSTGASDLTMDMTNPRILYAGMWRGERKPWALISGAEEGRRLQDHRRRRQLGEARRRAARRDGGQGRGERVARGPGPRVGRSSRPSLTGGVYRSDDAGATWTRTNSDNNLRQRGLVLHARAGGSRRSEHGVRPQHRHVPFGRRRDDI